MIKIDTEYTKLYDYEGDMTKRWSIAFKIWDHQKQSLVRRFDYEVNKLDTADKRYLFAKKRIKNINKLLSSGHSLNKDSIDIIAKRTIQGAFLEIMELKSTEYAHRTKESMKSSISIFLEFIAVSNKSDYDIRKLSKNDFLDYRDWLLKNKSISTRTVNNYVGYCKILINAMIEREWITESPLFSIKTLRVHDTLKNRAW